MPDRRTRLLLVSSHPVPNASAVLRELGERGDLDVLVAYCSLDDRRLHRGPEFLTKAAFDVPMLEGHRWVAVPNRALRPALGRFAGLVNPGLVPLVRRADCVVVFGYAYASLLLAIAAARALRRPLLVSTDATALAPADRRWYKLPLKRRIVPRLLRWADVVLTPSSAGRRFLLGLGLPPERIALTPYAVDNGAIAARAAAADRQAVREAWGVGRDTLVAAMCAKLIPRKRPLDVVRAFARAGLADAALVIAGNGPLGEVVAAECRRLAVERRVRRLGLVKYSELPAVYAAADVLVVASEHEPWGLPVNEAMVCGTPVVASDRVGAAEDLIDPGVTGFAYPCGDVGALAALLRGLDGDRPALRRMGAAARGRMETWSPRENARALADAVARALRRRERPR